MKALVQLVASSAAGIGIFILLLFVPAGTLNYWQGWTFIVVFAVSTLLPSCHLAKHDPEALRRRMKAGPTNETRPVQRLVIAICFLLVPGMMVVAGLDRRFGWTTVPDALVIAGDVLVAVGLVMAQWVVIQNAYAAATIIVEPDQPLVSTGWYGIVRHPLYVGALVMMVGTPLALGSPWALPIIVPGFAVLAVRIVDEEKMLTEELTGYRDYTTRVRYRLVPGVW